MDIISRGYSLLKKNVIQEEESLQIHELFFSFKKTSDKLEQEQILRKIRAISETNPAVLTKCGVVSFLADYIKMGFCLEHWICCIEVLENLVSKKNPEKETVGSLMLKEEVFISFLFQIMQKNTTHLREALFLLCFLVEQDRIITQENVLSIPGSISVIAGFFQTNNEVIRNEVILVLLLLCEKNTEIQNMAVFGGVFENAFDVLFFEGGCVSNTVCFDCFRLIFQLLHHNVSGQRYFRDAISPSKLVMLLREAISDPKTLQGRKTSLSHLLSIFQVLFSEECKESFQIMFYEECIELFKVLSRVEDEELRQKTFCIVSCLLLENIKLKELFQKNLFFKECVSRTLQGDKGAFLVIESYFSCNYLGQESAVLSLKNTESVFYSLFDLIKENNVPAMFVLFLLLHQNKKIPEIISDFEIDGQPLQFVIILFRNYNKKTIFQKKTIVCLCSSFVSSSPKATEQFVSSTDSVFNLIEGLTKGDSDVELKGLSCVLLCFCLKKTNQKYFVETIKTRVGGMVRHYLRDFLSAEQEKYFIGSYGTQIFSFFKEAAFFFLKEETSFKDTSEEDVFRILLKKKEDDFQTVLYQKEECLQEIERLKALNTKLFEDFQACMFQLECVEKENASLLLKLAEEK